MIALKLRRFIIVRGSGSMGTAGQLPLLTCQWAGPWLEMEGWGGVGINFADRRAWFWVWLLLSSLRRKKI